MAATIYKAHKARREPLFLKMRRLREKYRKAGSICNGIPLFTFFFSLSFHPFGTWSSSFYYTCECVEQPAVQWITA